MTTRDSERRWPWTVAGYALLLAIVAAAAGFIHDSAAPAHRPVVIRLAVAVVLAIVLIHLRSHFRGDPRWDAPSPFEDALRRQAPSPKLDPSFVRLRDEVANGLASRSYFRNILWPRLFALAQTHRPPVALTPPPERGWPGRGPARRDLVELIDRIESARTDRP
jgi:hypothetical protein